MLWTVEVEDGKSIDKLITSASTTERPRPVFKNLDFKIASGLKNILTINFKKHITTTDGKPQSGTRSLASRQIAWVIYVDPTFCRARRIQPSQQCVTSLWPHVREAICFADVARVNRDLHMFTQENTLAPRTDLGHEDPNTTTSGLFLERSRQFQQLADLETHLRTRDGPSSSDEPSVGEMK